MSTVLTSQRRIRIFTVGISASVSLYFLAALVAEPLRAFAATDQETVVVQLEIGEAIGLACDGDYNGSTGSGETLSLGTITAYGDTGAYSHARAAHCRIHTNNQFGYTLSWQVQSGSGGAFTGHLINQFEDIIPAFGTGSAHNYTKTWELNPGNTNLEDSRWGGRVSSTSSGEIIAPMDWGTDGVSEKWARVKTGSSLPIWQKTSPSQGGLLGDIIRIGFRVQIGALKSQPSGVYKATVTFTAATQN